MDVKDLMRRPVVCARVHDSMSIVEALMTAHGLRHLPVVDAAGSIVGVVSHRDVLAASLSTVADLTSPERSTFSDTVQVFEIMRPAPVTISPHASAASAGKIMLERRLGCVPVVDEHNKVVGIVTESDFVRFALGLLGEPRS